MDQLLVNSERGIALGWKHSKGKLFASYALGGKLLREDRVRSPYIALETHFLADTDHLAPVCVPRELGQAV